MKKLLIVLLASLLILIGSLTPIKAEEEITKPIYPITEKIKNAAISIFNASDKGFSRCSGVIINSRYGLTSVLTAKHCIDTAEEMYVENKEVSLIIASKNDDLALLLVKGAIKNKYPINIAKNSPQIGETVYHISYPDWNAYEKTGTLLRITKDWQIYRMYVIPGSSGGGIFNEKDELVGIVWGGLFLEDITIVEPIEDIKNFLKEVKLYTKWLNL